MAFKLKSLTLGIALLAAFNSTFAQDYKVYKSYPIVDGATRWDYIAINPYNDFIYVANSTRVSILNKNGLKAGYIPNTEGVHGICFAPALSKGFTSNGKSNTVTVFNSATNNIFGQIKVGENPDFILYDAFSGKVYVCNGHSEDISVIDPAANRVVATIKVGGKPEAAVSDGAGQLFVNIEDKNEIIAINTTRNEVVSHWPLKKGKGPTGLAMDVKAKRLFAGCDNKLLEVMNAANGKIVAELPIGDGCDGVVFDADQKRIFSSNGSGTLTIVSELPADKYKVVQTLATAKTARTIALNEKNHMLYLPAADVAATTDTSAHGRPGLVEGSLKVLVVGRGK